MQALAVAETPDDAFKEICIYNQQLLGLEADGSCTMLRRILELIQDTSLEPRQGSQIIQIVDAAGQQVERHVLLQRERSILCEVIC